MIQINQTLIHMIFLALLGTLSIFSTPTLAQESWQQVHGPYFSAALPKRPLIPLEANARLKELRDFIKISPPYSLEGDIKCPIATSIYQEVFERIIQANHLKLFRDEGPGLILQIECSDNRESIRDGFGSDASTNVFNVIVMNAAVLMAMNSDDELAIILGHEMAHALWGHTDLKYNITKDIKSPWETPEEIQPAIKKHTEKAEPEADYYGTLLAWNARYNPAAFQIALKNLEQYYINNIGESMVMGVGRVFFDDGHGSPSKRFSRLRPLFDAIGIDQKTYSLPPLSTRIQNAREEFQANSQRLKLRRKGN